MGYSYLIKYPINAIIDIWVFEGMGNYFSILIQLGVTRRTVKEKASKPHIKNEYGIFKKLVECKSKAF
jgi:hypothetical protein